jgi:hypothetical protein
MMKLWPGGSLLLKPPQIENIERELIENLRRPSEERAAEQRPTTGRATNEKSINRPQAPER